MNPYIAVICLVNNDIILIAWKTVRASEIIA